DDPPPLYLIEHLAGKLEVGALLIDGPRPASPDQDSAAGRGDEIGEAGGVRAGLQGIVGHPLKSPPTVSLPVAASVRAGSSNPPRLVPGGLPSNDGAVANEVPAPRGHTVVIPCQI